MKKWAIPIAAAAIAIVAVAGVAFALTDSGDNDAGSRVSRDPDSGEDSGAADCANPPCDDVGDGGLACIEGAIDCDDTIEKPADDICIQIFPTPLECTDPDAPVTNEPPSDNGGSGFGDCSVVNVNNVRTCEKAAIALASEDLAERLGSADAIAVRTIEAVEWPDACLGVSQADIACAEVITPGFQIVLEADGQKYEYHTDGISRAVLVE